MSNQMGLMNRTSSLMLVTIEQVFERLELFGSGRILTRFLILSQTLRTKREDCTMTQKMH